METQKIKVDELKLSEIIQEFSKGKIRIPRFQRDYVWDKSRVVKLLNSIYREYPIGTFFFWEASPEYAHLYRNIPELNIPDPDEHTTFKFILDGQQRLTSLFVAINGLVLNIQDKNLKTKKIDYSEISFDLDKEEFTVRRPDSSRFVSLASMLDEDEHFKLLRMLPDEQALAFERCRKRFSSYPLSVVYVRNQDLGEACEIFERINQGGIKLSLFDLVVASTWSNEFDLKEEVNKLNAEISKSGFGVIPPENILQALSLYIKGPATKVAQLQLKKDEIIESWPLMSEAVKLAVDHLRANLGAKIVEFLPYTSMIAMFAYFLAKKQNKSLSAIEKEFVEEWFWKAAFSQRYTVSTGTLMGEDRRDLFDKMLHGERPVINYATNLTTEEIKYTKLYRYSSIRNGILCLMAQKGPLHFANSSAITLDRSALSDFNSPERHHIFPRAYLRRTTKTYDENSIANFAFIPQELNRQILDATPSNYLPGYLDKNSQAKEILKSHFISDAAYKSITDDDFEAFISTRSETLLKEAEKKIGKISPIEIKLKENPNEVIDILEERLRVIVDLNLEEKFGPDYWKEAIPGNIQENVAKRLNENSKRYPDKSAISNFERLSFFNFGEYKDIILLYWKAFEDEFISRGDFERNFMFLNDYRNAVKHNRQLSSIESKQGEAAAEWFANLLDPYFSAKTSRQIEIARDVNNKPLYFLNSEDNMAQAKGVYLDDGKFMVFAGSTARPDVVPSFGKHVSSSYNLRVSLENENILIPGHDGEGLKLKHDYIFNSPSSASDILMGRATNGWLKWKDEAGRTLDENERALSNGQE